MGLVPVLHSAPRSRDVIFADYGLVKKHRQTISAMRISKFSKGSRWLAGARLRGESAEAILNANGAKEFGDLIDLFRP
jgi:hypothetical protein